MVLQWNIRKVKKINKKIIYISLAVLVLILSTSAVTALVSPPPGIKDPSLSKVWAAIMDLQTQIKGLVAKDLDLQGQISTLGSRMTAVEAKAPTIKRTAETNIDIEDYSKYQSVECDAGKKVLGGGGAIGGTYSYDRVFITSSYPSRDDTWTVVAEEATPTDTDWFIETFAICA